MRIEMLVSAAATPVNPTQSPAARMNAFDIFFMIIVLPGWAR